MSISAILVAAGSGTRLGGIKKQFKDLGGKPLLFWSLQELLDCPAVAQVILVLPQEDVAEFFNRYGRKYLPDSLLLKICPVAGGSTREESVRLSLKELRTETRMVLIHDAARPFLSGDLLNRMIEAGSKWGAATAAVPAKDTIKLSMDGEFFTGSLKREELWQVQTPQIFRREWICQAHQNITQATDDTSKVETLGQKIRLIQGDYRNIKITTSDDWELAESFIRERSPVAMRIGQGWDLHRLEEGRSLILGGITIPSDFGLLGHSDADVLTHALIDALLGAAKLGNIGQLFPDNDPAYKGIDSMELLTQTKSMLKVKGYTVVNIDATVIAQAPKLLPYLEKMAARIAEVLDIEADVVSVKAKTHEEVDAIGKGMAMAAQVVCLLQKTALI